MLECLVDGEISDRVSAADRGLQFGDGLYENIAVFGGLPRFWQGHIDRLNAGFERLEIPAIPQSILLRELKTVSAGQAKCIVKIIVTRGGQGSGYAPGSPAQPNRIVCSEAWPFQEPDPALFGIRARICDLRLAIQPELGGLGHLNRLERVLARAEWEDSSIPEGILLDREDHVVSAISSNIFLVFSGRLLTPRLDRCGVRGVMRGAILSAFRERCEQRRLMLDMLPDAQEIFLCNSIQGIIPVTRIDHWEYEIGPVTRDVQAWLAKQ
jgi:4-amino-4-deoxychorismate lyase